MKSLSILITSLGLAASANAQFSVSGAGDTIPTGGVNSGNSAGWDVNNLDHDFTLTDAPGMSTVSVPVAVNNITSVEIQGLTHTWSGDTQCILSDPNGIGYHVWLRPEIEPGETCCGNSGDFLGGTYLFVEPGTSSNGVLPEAGDIAPGDYDQSWESNSSLNNLVWPDGDENVFNVPFSGITGPAGTWTLHIYDWAAGDSGSFTGWTLNGNGSGSGGPGMQYCPGDGVYAPCPCANVNDGSMGGCDWTLDGSFPSGGVLNATGSNVYANNDTFLVATNVNADFGIFFGANNATAGTLNDGIRCAGGGLVRLIPPTNPGSNTATHTTSLQQLDPTAGVGVTRRYQYWFRANPGPCSTTANTTNGYEITWM